MAVKQDVISPQFFVGEDKRLVFTIYESDKVTPKNVSGWAISWMLKRSVNDTDGAAKITKTVAGGGVTITGVFNVVPATNTQRVNVQIEDTDTHLLPAGLYAHELKRTDAGVEVVLAYGQFQLPAGVHKT